MVGFGMIGTSISGVSFISVPGWVSTTGMTYLQMCAGFFFGYLVVAFVLLPLYYRLRLTSIYAYLGMRFGDRTRRTGAFFFLLSKLTGAAARLYIICVVLQQFLFPGMTANSFAAQITFASIAIAVLCLIWFYTRKGGIFTIVRTDALQTFCLLAALCIMAVLVAGQMNLNFEGVLHTVTDSPMSRIFEWDTADRQNFWKQFFSGIFIVIVMTGLDQDMMQKNLTCKTLREAQKNMCAYGACFLPVNALLLALGVLLYTFCATRGLSVPASGDELLPALVQSGALGVAVIVPFTIGIVAAAFSSADSALAALTTSCCLDLLRIEERGLSEQAQTSIRRRVHLGVCTAFLVCILLFRIANSTSVINAIYVMASYTYGPLLGLYAFGLALRQKVSDRRIPVVCVSAPLVCALLDYGAPHWWEYTFGYELLMLNGAMTFAGMWLISRCGGRTRLPRSAKPA